MKAYKGTLFEIVPRPQTFSPQHFKCDAHITELDSRKYWLPKPKDTTPFLRRRTNPVTETRVDISRSILSLATLTIHLVPVKKQTPAAAHNLSCG